jgi:hypothetical protein
MSTSLEIEPPEFNPSQEEDDVEYFCLRAPAHLDVSEILNGVTLNVDSAILKASSRPTNDIISRFKAEFDGNDYALTLLDAKESEVMRLLVPDYEDEDKLIPFKPFKGQLNLTAVVSGIGDNAGDGSSNIQTDLLLAPAEERAPKPALEQSGNGAVDKMRLAYVHVPQKDGLKRRWAMPGSSGVPQPVVKEGEGDVSERSHKKSKKSQKH